MSACPLFVELCAGTAALSLRLHAGRNARPPVSRMGAKTGYADVILRCLGLRPGQGHTGGTRYLWCEPDAGVRLLLHAYTDRELAQGAAEIIRSWRDEDPRALWERLRAEGPALCPEGLTAREVARWQIVIGSMWVHKQDGRSMSGWMWCADKPRPPEHIARMDTLPTLPAAIHPDARKVDPREVARWVLLGEWSFRRGEVSSGPCGPSRWADTEWRTAAGAVGRRPGTTVEVIARPMTAAPTLPASITEDARTLDPPTLPPGTVAYMDPPYLNTTGYAHDLGRPEVVKLARRWADAGALVCISEAEPIGALVGDGWHQVEITGERKGQRRTFSKQQREWLTVNRPPAWVPSVQAPLFGAA